MPQLRCKTPLDHTSIPNLDFRAEILRSGIDFALPDGDVIPGMMSIEAVLRNHAQDAQWVDIAP